MNDFLHFPETSYTAYQAAENARTLLQAHGFRELDEGAPWDLQPQGKYFVVRGGSAVIAFVCGDAKKGFKIAASHLDSPCLKLKENPALSDGHCTRLNAEPYGGGIWHTFFDRPLRLAGRVVREENGALRALPFASDFLVSLPSLAIHLDRDVNEKFAPNLQENLPLLTLGQKDFYDLLRGPVSYDLYAACAEKPYFWGADGEFLSSPRLDDLASAYASLHTLAETPCDGVCVAACLDAEEIGSRTRQGAGGDFLRAVLARIAQSQSLTQADYYAALAASFCISIDNAQGFHPNYPAKFDPSDRAYLGKGVALKSHAGGAYATDALAAAVVRTVFSRAGAPLQVFYNRSDMRSGGTLGTISIGQASILTADIGIPQLAMHSAVETIACADFAALETGLSAFWKSRIRISSDGAEVL